MTGSFGDIFDQPLSVSDGLGMGGSGGGAACTGFILTANGVVNFCVDAGACGGIEAMGPMSWIIFGAKPRSFSIGKGA